MSNTEKVLLGFALIFLLIALFMYVSNQYNPDPSPSPAQPPSQYQESMATQLDLTQNLPKGELVMFYANFCGHCQNLKPVWDEFTNNFNGYNGINIIKVDGEQNPELVQMHGVQGFPTIKYCPFGVVNPDGVQYSGDRSLNSLMQFLQQCM